MHKEPRSKLAVYELDLGSKDPRKGTPGETVGGDVEVNAHNHCVRRLGQVGTTGNRGVSFEEESNNQHERAHEQTHLSSQSLNSK